MFIDCQQRKALGVPVVQIADELCHKSGIANGDDGSRVEAGVVQERSEILAFQWLRVVKRRLVGACRNAVSEELHQQSAM